MTKKSSRRWGGVLTVLLLAATMLFTSCQQIEDLLYLSKWVNTPALEDPDVIYFRAHTGETITITQHAESTDGGTLSYQWYINDENDFKTAQPIPGETSDTIVITKNEDFVAEYWCNVTNTTKKGSNSLESWGFTVVFTAFEELPNEISSDMTLNPEYTYYVRNTTVKNGATLTIPAGTVLKLSSWSLKIVDDAKIIAEGTEDNPIIFTSQRDKENGVEVKDREGDKFILFEGDPEEGDCGYIEISGAAGSSFKYCIFQYGKQLCLNKDATVENCTFRNNGDPLWYAFQGALAIYEGIHPVVKHNTFYDNAWPIAMAADINLGEGNVFHTGEGETLKKNTYQAIYIMTKEIPAEKTVTWNISEIPYWISGLSISGTLNLVEDTIVKVRDNCGITIEEGGSLIVPEDESASWFLTSVCDEEHGGKIVEASELSGSHWWGVEDKNNNARYNNAINNNTEHVLYCR